MASFSKFPLLAMRFPSTAASQVISVLMPAFGAVLILRCVGLAEALEVAYAAFHRLLADKDMLFGAPEGIRTPGLCLRREEDNGI
jgi:1-acyl-sn-glycerol-3-phosphate acyltransferase